MTQREPGPSKKASDRQQDAPRVADEHRLEPQVKFGDGPKPPVAIVEKRDEKAPARTASEHAYDGPGLSAANELLAMPNPNHIAIADVMVEHPSEREVILAEVRKRGDAMLVERVLAAESAIREEQQKLFKMGKAGPQVGDTKVYPAPAFSTDPQYDNVQEREAAREARQLERDAQRRGDKPYDPIGDKLRGPEPATQADRNAQRKADEAIDSMRQQLQPDAGTPQRQ